MKRTIATALGIAVLGPALASAQTVSAADCVAQSRLRTRGSMSPKGSTPVGGGASTALEVRQQPTGTMSAKASTPVNPALDRPRTTGSTTPKGSVGIANPPAACTTAVSR